MKIRRLPIMLVALMALTFIHGPTQAQPGGDPTIEAAAPVVVTVIGVADGVALDGTPPFAVAAEPALADKEVTPEKLGEQARKVVKDWKTVGWLAGLAALIAFLILLLKYKPVDALFERWEIKWLKPLIASVLGAASSGITAYILEGDVVDAIIAGLLIIGPAAVGYFETVNKVKARNRDKGKNGGKK